ncbi:MAG: phage tail protein, partial [Nitrososphaerales archaeon]
KTSVYTVQADENAMKTEVDYGIDKLVNQVIICGAGSQAGQLINQLKVQNTPSITAFGAWSKIINLPNCADPNLLQAYANALLNDLGGNIYTVNAKLADLSTGVSFKMGDYVSVNNPSFNLNNALFRVVSEKRHYDAQQAEDVNVVLAQNYRMVNVTHFKLKRLEDILNSQLQNQQIFNNNFSQTPSQLPLQITDSQGANIGVGKFQSFSAYLVISVSGINAGFTPNFVPSGQSGIAVTASNALDTYTNTNYSCGTFYSADVYDHIFKITGTVYNGGASQYTGTVSLTVTLTQPTIPQ